MKDAIGSVFNLTLLFVFILIVSGFVLFGVNYYKAFQVKNALLTYIEKYEGNVNNSNFKEKVNDTIKGVGYTGPGDDAIISFKNNNTTGWQCPYASGGSRYQGWCYFKRTYITKTNTTTEFDVATFVSVDIPVINRIMLKFKFFQVVGRTKPILVR